MDQTEIKPYGTGVHERNYSLHDLSKQNTRARSCIIDVATTIYTPWTTSHSAPRPAATRLPTAVYDLTDHTVGTLESPDWPRLSTSTCGAARRLRRVDAYMKMRCGAERRSAATWPHDGSTLSSPSVASGHLCHSLRAGPFSHTALALRSHPSHPGRA